MNKLINLKSLIITIIIILGLGVSLYLIKNPKIFKSHANAKFEYENAIQVTDDNNQPLKYKSDGQYELTSQKVKISVKDPNKFTSLRNNSLDTSPVKIQPDQQIIPGTTIGPAEGNTDTMETVPKNTPPMSTIPEACSFLGPSIQFDLPQISNTTLERAADLERQYGPMLYLSLPIVTWGRWLGNTYLPLKYTSVTEYPLSAAGDDIRWAWRVIRIAYALDDPHYGRYWYGRNYPGISGLNLEDGCLNIKKLMEQQLLQNKWIPSYDWLEKEGAKMLG